MTWTTHMIRLRLRGKWSWEWRLSRRSSKKR